MRSQRLMMFSAGGALLLAGSLAAGPSASVVAQESLPQPATPSAGCGTTAPAPVDWGEGGSMLVDGSERTWRLHVPPAHDGLTPVPLVLLLHGLGEDAGIIRNLTTSGLPDEKGFVVVAPQGSGLISRWMWDLGDSEYDLSLENPDIAFIDALLDELGSSLCLDTSRIYAAGYSNGAIGVSALGCVLGERIAAIAGIAGLTDFGASCNVERPMPTLAIQAADDPYVLIDGGWGDGIDAFMLEDFVTYADQPITSWPGFQASFQQRLDGIAARNGCSPESTIEAMTESAERQVWSCEPGAEVEMIITHGAGHAWPATIIDVGAEMWSFFSRQALPPDPGT